MSNFTPLTARRRLNVRKWIVLIALAALNCLVIYLLATEGEFLFERLPDNFMKEFMTKLFGKSDDSIRMLALEEEELVAEGAGDKEEWMTMILNPQGDGKRVIGR